jgi:hypothetical protein
VGWVVEIVLLCHSKTPFLSETRKISSIVDVKMWRRSDLRLHVIWHVAETFMGFILSFDFLDGFVFYHFNIVLVTSAQSLVKPRDVFAVWIKFFSDIQYILIKDGRPDLFLVPIASDVLNYLKNYLQIVLVDLPANATKIISCAGLGYILK